MNDKINHPAHYTQGGIECIDYIESQKLGYHAGNAIKYITRYRHKNGVEDLEKAAWYIERLIQNLSLPVPIEEDKGVTKCGLDGRNCSDDCAGCTPVVVRLNGAIQLPESLHLQELHGPFHNFWPAEEQKSIEQEERAAHEGHVADIAAYLGYLEAPPVVHDDDAYCLGDFRRPEKLPKKPWLYE